MHHLKHIRKGRVEGFAQIMQALNRKTIPVCKKCHRRIHNGEYSGESLSKIWKTIDKDLITA